LGGRGERKARRLVRARRGDGLDKKGGGGTRARQGGEVASQDIWKYPKSYQVKNSEKHCQVTLLK